MNGIGVVGDDTLKLVDSGFLIAVRTKPRAGRGARRAWRERFMEAAAKQVGPSWLGLDGALIEWDDGRVGTYRFVELGEAQRSFATSVWFDLKTRCPLVGPVVGFLHIDVFSRDGDLREWLLGQLLYISRGFLVRLDDGRRIDAIIEEDFTLDNCNQKHGFHDGECLYGHNDTHTDHLRSAILLHLKALGLPARMITFATGHNPLRIEEIEPGLHGSSEDGWRAFERHKDEILRLWVFNWVGVDSPKFAQLVGL